MGSFYMSDCVTGSTIQGRDPMVALHVQLLEKRAWANIKIASTDFYTPITVAVHGTYADYGQIEPSDMSALGVRHLLGITQQADWETLGNTLHAGKPIPLALPKGPEVKLSPCYMHQATWQALLDSRPKAERDAEIDAVVAQSLEAAAFLKGPKSEPEFRDNFFQAFSVLSLNSDLGHRRTDGGVLLGMLRYSESQVSVVSDMGRDWMTGPAGAIGVGQAIAILEDGGVALREVLTHLLEQYTVLTALTDLGRPLVPSLYGSQESNAQAQLAFGLQALRQVMQPEFKYAAEDDASIPAHLLQLQSELHALVFAVDRQIAHLQFLDQRDAQG